jgi:pimeloyl-ACP methyl ester carboxylesterase
VVANEYGAGDRGVVLAHGARFDKESWDPEARALAGSGFRVLAIDFRGYGGSRAGSAPQALELDVLAAVRFLRGSGAHSVAVVGGSMGGGAAAQAAVAAEPGEIDRLVLLAHAPIDHPERMQGRKLFVVSRGDVDAKGSPRLARIQDQYERAPGPKEIVVLDGSAHAQNIFGTEQGPELSSSILRFLSAP